MIKLKINKLKDEIKIKTSKQEKEHHVNSHYTMS
jgi:hypothetical protein